MNYTNLNIKSGKEKFKYIVEYFGKNANQTSELKYFTNEFGISFLMEGQSNICYQKNFWNDIENSIIKTDSVNIPKTYNTSLFNLYFPRYSVNLFERNIYYVLSLNTWINGVPIYLGTFLIDRRNTLAPKDGTKKFLNEEYYEYVSVETINPFDIIYSDDWKNFRKYYCGELEINGLQKNNSVSNINVTLSAVKKVDNIWIKLDNYDSTQSVLVLNKSEDNNFSGILTFNTEDGNPKFVCETKFNSLYNCDLQTYLEETYQVTVDETFKMKYCFVIGDKNNPYKYKEHVFDTPVNTYTFNLEDFVFSSWSDYSEGLFANCYIIFQKDNEDIIVLITNKVYITQEIFKYLFNEEIRKIDLESVNDMNTNSFNVVNVIENKIVTLERPNEYKSNIVKPIFVKVQDADSIRIHKSVTENICINLDAYKNKVDAFVLKIGDTNFYEIGRINSGIIFKVNGANVQLDNGYYYILNNEGELVTTGKFTTI